jgi:hypothetical protein
MTGKKHFQSSYVGGRAWPALPLPALSAAHFYC